jgi:hypothetical protein
MGLPERKKRWRTNWTAIEDASALGWGRSFLAALLRASAAKVERRHEQDADTLPVGRMRSAPDVRTAGRDVRLI